MFPRNSPDLADLIDGTIGELSPFHDTFGYYAQGVGETTARLPDGWRERLLPVSNPNTRGATGWCLEPHDLVISKLVAGREKDLRFAEVAVRHGLVERDTLLDRLGRTSLDDTMRGIVQARIKGLR